MHLGLGGTVTVKLDGQAIPSHQRVRTHLVLGSPTRLSHAQSVGDLIKAVYGVVEGTLSVVRPNN